MVLVGTSEVSDKRTYAVFICPQSDSYKDSLEVDAPPAMTERHRGNALWIVFPIKHE